MSMGGGDVGGTPLSEINVTPLVDVMLVLLIIFMVTAPLIQQGVAVDLPKTRAPSLDSDENKLVLSLTKEKKVFLGEDEIPYDLLEEKLKDNKRIIEEKEVYLHADRALPYGFVVDVMAILKDSGVETLGMVTDPLVRGE
jgi:biopolymer transport protein TolR